MHVEYEELPAILTIEQAIAASSYYPNPHTIAKVGGGIGSVAILLSLSLFLSLVLFIII